VEMQVYREREFLYSRRWADPRAILRAVSGLVSRHLGAPRGQSSSSPSPRRPAERAQGTCTDDCGWRRKPPTALAGSASRWPHQQSGDLVEAEDAERSMDRPSWRFTDPSNMCFSGRVPERHCPRSYRLFSGESRAADEGDFWDKAIQRRAVERNTPRGSWPPPAQSLPPGTHSSFRV
jgi:hypothetical protein